MDLITAEHVQALSAAPEGSALVISEGRAQVLPGPLTDQDGYLVISREDLNGLLHTSSPGRSDLDDLALRLNSAVVEQGG